MKRVVLQLVLVTLFALNATAQGAKNIRINEVMTHNTTSIEDEYGRRHAWVELCNSSFTTFNIRGMYITTDPAVLAPQLSAPERQKLMSLIPSDEPRTLLSARQHLLFFLGSDPARGSLHITAKAMERQPLWVALYDGNGIDLIDSVTVPPLAANTSYARQSDGGNRWEVRAASRVTPATANTPHYNNKIARTKAEDPNGFAITILAMGTVFSCLALLYIFFRLLGLLMDHLNTAQKIAHKQPLKPVTKTVEVVDEIIDTSATILKDGLKTKGIDKKVYIAVIAMALKQYADDVHDVESGIITIKPHHSDWNIHINQINNI